MVIVFQNVDLLCPGSSLCSRKTISPNRSSRGLIQVSGEVKKPVGLETPIVGIASDFGEGGNRSRRITMVPVLKLIPDLQREVGLNWGSKWNTDIRHFGSAITWVCAVYDSIILGGGLGGCLTRTAAEGGPPIM